MKEILCHSISPPFHIPCPNVVETSVDALMDEINESETFVELLNILSGSVSLFLHMFESWIIMSTKWSKVN